MTRSLRAAAVAVAMLTVPLTAAPAAACDTTYRFRPELPASIRDLALFRGDTCSSGVSLTAAAFVLVVVLVLAAVTVRGTLRRGEERARELTGGDPGALLDRQAGPPRP